MRNQAARYFVLLLLIIVGPMIVGNHVVFAQAADDCSWTYAGSDRAAVKNRSATQRSTQVNRGRSITVGGWYDLVCPLGNQVPPKSEISEDRPIPGLETMKVILRGFILTVKFERGEDHVFMLKLRLPHNGVVAT